MPHLRPRLPKNPLLVALLLGVASGACQTEPPVTPAPPSVTSSAFGLVFTPFPGDFEVETNDDSTLSFRPTGEPEGQEPAARVWVELGPTGQANINLVDVVNSQKAIFEALPGGEFFGSRELRTPLGPAYYSRGRFDLEGDGRVEEVRLFQIHPGQYRLLTLYYRYPAAEDSAQRLQQLLELAAAMEATGEKSPEMEQSAAGPVAPETP